MTHVATPPVAAVLSSSLVRVFFAFGLGCATFGAALFQRIDCRFPRTARGT